MGSIQWTLYPPPLAQKAPGLTPLSILFTAIPKVCQFTLRLQIIEFKVLKFYILNGTLKMR